MHLAHECDQDEDEGCQYGNAAKETDHVGLHLASFNASQVAARCHDQPGHAIDNTINNVGIEGLLDMREAKYSVADEQVVEFIHVEFTQENAMRHAQCGVTLYVIVYCLQPD